MRPKELPGLLKGGIVGIIIYLIILLLLLPFYLFNRSNDIFIFIYFFFILVPSAYFRIDKNHLLFAKDVFSVPTLIGYIFIFLVYLLFFFILGSLIGYIIIKIKSKIKTT